jgi:hypothetical protein
MAKETMVGALRRLITAILVDARSGCGRRAQGRAVDFHSVALVAQACRCDSVKAKWRLFRLGSPSAGQRVIGAPSSVIGETSGTAIG